MFSGQKIADFCPVVESIQCPFPEVNYVGITPRYFVFCVFCLFLLFSFLVNCFLCLLIFVHVCELVCLFLVIHLNPVLKLSINTSQLMSIHRKQVFANSLKIIVWNIQGTRSNLLGNKLCNQNFLSEVKESDIVCLVETHENESSDLALTGFRQLISVRRTKTRVKSSGGIAVFIRQTLVEAVSVVNSLTTTDTIWIKLKKEYFNESSDIFIGTVYFSPENYENKYNKDYIAKLEHDIAYLKSKGEIIIQGDFNARIGTEKDSIVHSKYFDQDSSITSINTNSLHTLPRNSYDFTTNSRGTDLLDLCIASDLCIVNGRKIGDTNGKFTCYTWNGSSVVDYVIASYATFEKIIYCQVRDLIPSLSDHSALKYNLCLQHKSQIEDSSLNEIPKKYLWDSTTRANMLKTLNSQAVKDSFNDLTLKLTAINSKPSGIANVKMVTDLIKATCDISGIKTRSHRKHTTKYKKPWFDLECKLLKQDLMLIGKQVSREKLNSKTRKELSLKKKQFKNLIKKKKLEYQYKTIKQIASTKNNPREHWKLLDTLRRDHNEQINYVEAIDSSQWIKMFKSLLQSGKQISLSNPIENSETDSTMTNVITLTELQIAIKKLKQGKSAGLDQISNEMIICCVETYPEIFLDLFNSLLHYRVFPETWSQSIIVPIHKK